MGTSVVKMETFPLLYLIRPSINQQLATQPRISILTKQNWTFFIPKRIAAFPCSSSLVQSSILQWILFYYKDSPSLQGEGTKWKVH